jgi:hypothetical protein
MALRIRNNKNIKGFQVKIDEINHSIKISQLADDTTLFFNSKTEIPLALNEIEIFYVNIGTIKDLIIKIFPKIVKFLFVHKSNKLFIFSNSKCFKFIWNNKPDKVKRNTVVGKLGNGGLKMIDIQSYFMSLKASPHM